MYLLGTWLLGLLTLRFGLYQQWHRRLNNLFHLLRHLGELNLLDRLQLWQILLNWSCRQILLGLLHLHGYDLNRLLLSRNLNNIGRCLLLLTQYDWRLLDRQQNLTVPVFVLGQLLFTQSYDSRLLLYNHKRIGSRNRLDIWLVILRHYLNHL